MLQPNRNSSSTAYRYGFQGQEKDDEVKDGNGTSINYKFRMHDPRVGRFFAVDPLEAKYPDYSPYIFSGNKVIHAVEFEGLEEVTIHSASFAPFDHFATPIVIPRFQGVSKNPQPPLIIGPFSGDGNNRKFGVDPYASSRIYGSVGVDFKASGITIFADPVGRGSMSHDYGTLQTQKYSPGTFEAELKTSKSVMTKEMTVGNLEFHLFGSNEAFPAPSFLVPDIDVKGSISFYRKETESGGSSIYFFGSTFGDAFPANETFITDSSGNGVFLGVSGASTLGPEIMLAGNNSRPMASFSMTVNFDSEGLIQNVESMGKTYSVEEWNNFFKTYDEQSEGSTTRSDFVKKSNEKE